MGKVKIYKESGTIFIVTDGDRIDGLDVGPKPKVLQYPADGELTASQPVSNEIKIVDSKGTVIVDGLPVTKFFSKSGAAQLAVNPGQLVTLLNGSNYFGATKLETRISSTESDITALKNATKTTSGDRGIFLNDSKSAAASFMRLQANEAKLQVGGTGRTHITSSESSPGIHKFVVNAGASGSEAAVEALRITGSSTANTKASIETGAGVGVNFAGGLVSSGSTTLRSLSFHSTGSPHIVNFNNTTIQNLSLAASAISSGTFSTSRIPNLGASKIQSGTFADARISSSSVTQHAGDIDLADLGDVNDTAPTDGQVLTWDNANSYWKPATVSGGGSGISELSDDTSPQLGGHLDVNGQEIRSTSNNDITLRPNGTGTVVATAELTLDYTNPQIKFKGDDNIHYRISIDESANEVVIGHTTYAGIRMDSYGALTFPNINGSPSGGVTAGYLKVDGSGNVSTDTPTDTNTNIGNTDFTLAAARKLIVGGYDFSINDTTNSPLFLWDDSADIFEFRKPVLFTNTHGYTTGEVRLMEAPAASGQEYVGFKAPGNIAANCLWTLPTADGTNGQVLTTNGSKVLSWTNPTVTTVKFFYSGGAQLAYPYSRYLPLTGDVVEQNTAGSALSRTGFIAPYDGSVKKIIARSEETLGNTVLQWYKATDGTHAPATSLQSVTVDIDTANTSETYTYTSVTFSKGDILSLKIDPTSDPVSTTMEFNYIIEFEFDTST